jgi:hypothetical protein
MSLKKKAALADGAAFFCFFGQNAVQRKYWNRLLIHCQFSENLVS